MTRLGLILMCVGVAVLSAAYTKPGLQSTLSIIGVVCVWVGTSIVARVLDRG